MFESMSTAEKLLYSTVKINAISQGNIISTGTGFYSTFNRTSDGYLPVIITNKHVIRGADTIHIKCHIKDQNSNKPSGSLVNINISLNGRVINHPDDNVDLCAISFAEVINRSLNGGTDVFNSIIEMDLIPDESEWEMLDAIEEVTMTGCPNGLSDDTNNLPLVRRGITASDPSKLYNGRQEFVVDMACFPGSSGSPVFLYNPMGYFDKHTGGYQIGNVRLKLLGILYAGPQINQRGQIVLDTSLKFEIASMMHLGYVIRSSELKKLEEYFIANHC
ncbi:TPA: serine protease [Acinetobacter baumannii]|uniref:trypsin-like peptidase domain-containing protein n=1 Tax=Acinetobacter baumannii TaxID=470 RepID=UPI0009416DD2|nr:trypsin-like peptidase domain-containing protein [Acinetobacter baumannii]HAV5014693.1 serine protease [Acinetobacter baumannii]HAV5018779.1 serine protease [Acinetobacter baumannii]HAV5021942.1 serine protease [Acinetobacter baumannii]HAV5032950.1 serine protease [Acinetobacter baumannii]HAV5037261.1 serine protease [Acinetobacter baumannii]